MGTREKRWPSLCWRPCWSAVQSCNVWPRVLLQQGIGEAKMGSHERRMARFVANDRIVVTFVWKQFLAQILPYFRGQLLRFVLDATPFQDEMTIV